MVEYLQALPAGKPSVVLHTGGGVHAWWTFRSWIPAAEAIPLLEGWGRCFMSVASSMGFRVDATADITRMLRVPGTLNGKPADGPVAVEVVAWAPRPNYDPRDLAERIARVQRQRARRRRWKRR